MGTPSLGRTLKPLGGHNHLGVWTLKPIREFNEASLAPRGLGRAGLENYGHLGDTMEVCGAGATGVKGDLFIQVSYCYRVFSGVRILSESPRWQEKTKGHWSPQLEWPVGCFWRWPGLGSKSPGKQTGTEKYEDWCGNRGPEPGGGAENHHVHWGDWLEIPFLQLS